MREWTLEIETNKKIKKILDTGKRPNIRTTETEDKVLSSKTQKIFLVKSQRKIS